MHDRIWFDRPKYVEAREHYELFLTNNLTLQVSKSHEPILSKETKAVSSGQGMTMIMMNEIQNFLLILGIGTIKSNKSKS